PAGAEVIVVDHDDRADREHENCDCDLDDPLADARRLRFALFHSAIVTPETCGRDYFAKPASFISLRWYASSFSRNLTKSAPARKVSFSALRSTYSFHSGVATTFFIRSV